MDDRGDEELEAQQDGRVYPVGKALRATYGADNHDTLGSDVTGLMIDLSKVPYDEAERAAMARRPAPSGAVAPPPAGRAGAPPSWLARLVTRLGGRPASG